MSYVNADGLEILTAGEQGTAAKRGTSLSSQKKALEIKLRFYYPSRRSYLKASLIL